MENKPPPELIQCSDEVNILFLETCKRVGLGRGRTFEVAVFVLAEMLENKDPRTLATIELWKAGRKTMEIAADALEVAKLNG